MRTVRRMATPALRLVPSCSLKVRSAFRIWSQTDPLVQQHEGVTVLCTDHSMASRTPLSLSPCLNAPWPLTHRDATAPALQAIDATLPGAHALLDQGQWTPAPDVRDPPAGAAGLLPFIVDEAHCQQAKQKDRRLWKDAHDAHQAAPWGLTGYFLDPGLFRLLAHSARPEGACHVG